MDLDIQTEHVALNPEWDRMIEAWVRRCVKVHPEVVGLDFTLRHGELPRTGEKVDIVATTRGRSLRAAARGELMAEALHDALDALERELLVREAVSRRPH
jgi:ribosome-associated translation inhibitor RaiA